MLKPSSGVIEPEMVLAMKGGSDSLPLEYWLLTGNVDRKWSQQERNGGPLRSKESISDKFSSSSFLSLAWSREKCGGG